MPLPHPLPALPARSPSLPPISHPPAPMHTPPPVYRIRRSASTLPHKRPMSLWQYLAFFLLAVVGAVLAVWVTLVMN